MSGTLRERLAAAEDALKKAQEAQEAWRGYLSLSGLSDAPDANLARFCAVVADAVAKCRAERDALICRFAAVSILQVRLRVGGTERRIVVAKPDDRVDVPHIGEAFYSALAAKGEVVNLEDYDVAVVDSRGRARTLPRG